MADFYTVAPGRSVTAGGRTYGPGETIPRGVLLTIWPAAEIDSQVFQGAIFASDGSAPTTSSLGQAAFYTPTAGNSVAVGGATYWPGDQIPRSVLLGIWPEAEIDSQVRMGRIAPSTGVNPGIGTGSVAMRPGAMPPGTVWMPPSGEASFAAPDGSWQTVGGEWNSTQVFNAPVTVHDGMTADAIQASGQVQAGSIAAGAAQVSGKVAAGSVQASAIQGGAITASGQVSAGSINTGGAVQAGSVNAWGQVAAGSVQAGQGQFSGVNAGAITSSGQVTAGSIDTGALTSDSVNTSGQVSAGSVQTGGVGASYANVSGQMQAGSVYAGSIASPTIDQIRGDVSGVNSLISQLQAALNTVNQQIQAANAAAASAGQAAQNAANAANAAQNAANQANSAVSGLQQADSALSNRIGSLEGLRLGDRVPALEAKTANLPDFTFYQSNMTALANVITQANTTASQVGTLRNAYNGHKHYYTAWMDGAGYWTTVPDAQG